MTRGHRARPFDGRRVLARRVGRLDQAASDELLGLAWAFGVMREGVSRGSIALGMENLHDRPTLPIQRGLESGIIGAYLGGRVLRAA